MTVGNLLNIFESEAELRFCFLTGYIICGSACSEDPVDATERFNL